MDACGAFRLEPNSSKALFRRAQALNKSANVTILRQHFAFFRLGLKGRARADAVRCAGMEPQNKSIRELMDNLKNVVGIMRSAYTKFDGKIYLC